MTQSKASKSNIDQDLHDHLYTYYSVNELNEILSAKTIPPKLENRTLNTAVFFETIKQAIKSIEND